MSRGIRRIEARLGADDDFKDAGLGLLEGEAGEIGAVPGKVNGHGNS